MWQQQCHHTHLYRNCSAADQYSRYFNREQTCFQKQVQCKTKYLKCVLKKWVGMNLSLTNMSSTNVTSTNVTTKRWLARSDVPILPDRHCRWCTKPITNIKRKTFCSAQCVNQYRLRSSSAYVKSLLYKRDRGVCAACHTNTTELANVLRQQGHHHHPQYPHRRIWTRKWGGGLWDADHIVAVVNGGCPSLDRTIPFSIDQFQTLCIPCHQRKTVTDVATSKAPPPSQPPPSQTPPSVKQ